MLPQNVVKQLCNTTTLGNVFPVKYLIKIIGIGFPSEKRKMLCIRLIDSSFARTDVRSFLSCISEVEFIRRWGRGKSEKSNLFRG